MRGIIFIGDTMTGYKCRLKIIFAEKEIKVGEFAKKAGVSSAALSNIINNHTLPSFRVAYRICKELDMRIEEIWKEQE